MSKARRSINAGFDRSERRMRNRFQRRQDAKAAGVPWKAVRAAEKAEGVALQLSPEAAREALARWAATPGHTQAEVDALNAKGGQDAIAPN